MEEPEERLDRLAYAVIGAAIEVHRQLGPGFLESVYAKALCIELEILGIECRTEVGVGIFYKERSVGLGKIDLLVEGCLIVELKAVDSLAPIHSAQVISYLKATHLKLGLLMNFNAPMLKDTIKRIILT